MIKCAVFSKESVQSNKTYPTANPLPPPGCSKHWHDERFLLAFSTALAKPLSLNRFNFPVLCRIDTNYSRAKYSICRNNDASYCLIWKARESPTYLLFMGMWWISDSIIQFPFLFSYLSKETLRSPHVFRYSCLFTLVLMVYIFLRHALISCASNDAKEHFSSYSIELRLIAGKHVNLGSTSRKYSRLFHCVS